MPLLCRAFRPTFSKQLFRMASKKKAYMEPTSFGAQFRIPPSDETFVLGDINAHPVDKSLSFNEELHQYSFNNEVLSKSVTGLVGKYFNKFDPEAAIDLMINGSNWPRAQYRHEDGTVFTSDEIIKKWDDIGLHARNQGTWMHYLIERHFNNLEVSTSISEFKQFKKFHKDLIVKPKVKPFRTEWRIAAPDLSLGGSVDFIGQAADGSYVMMDWKRSKNLRTDMYKSYGKFARPPLQHLPDCDGTKYSLQLNLYRYILSRYYGIKVTRMVLASFHPSQSDAYFAAEIPIMEEEILTIVQDISSAKS